MIRRSFRRQRIGEFARLGEHVIDQRASGRSRRGHHVALDVAAGSDGAHQRFVEALHRLPQVGFDDAMKLEILASRDSQRVIAVPSGQLIAREILRGRESSPGKLGPHHQHVMLDHLALVPIILLVNAMELEELVIVI